MLTRIMFPYLFFVCLTALFSGVLNAIPGTVAARFPETIGLADSVVLGIDDPDPIVAGLLIDLGIARHDRHRDHRFRRRRLRDFMRDPGESL